MRHLLSGLALLLLVPSAFAVDPLPAVGGVEGQPLAANAERLAAALEFLGSPLPPDAAKALAAAVEARDAKAVQAVLDPRVLFLVTINPEARVKVARGPGDATLQQAGFVPVLVKVVNESTVKKALKVTSPQAGNVYGGAQGWSRATLKGDPGSPGRFLQAEVFAAPPMTADLSGLKVEYAVVLLYSTEAGKREATIGFDIGQGNQDLGFRAEVPVLFDVKPAVPVKLRVADADGSPTVGRFTFRDKLGHVYPPQPKRLAPDFFFQQQVYRPDGGTVLLAPGKFTVEYGRGPEYRVKATVLTVPADGPAELAVELDRWVDPMALGWYNGDHHIHAAGCAHYTSPTEGVTPEDMFLHVKGEGLNVGCCLTWGPCYDHQRKFFDAGPNKLSEPLTVLKYDVEVSGFGSQALGHVCLLNLRDQTYPGSAGTMAKGWPTWTTPLMRWAKEQGAVTGYAHSANGLGINPRNAARRMIAAHDADKDGKLSKDEAAKVLLLPERFDDADANWDWYLDETELAASHNRAGGKLPNVAVPEMNGIGAQEICVTTAMGVCDFISAMDTERTPEWNCWYHILNCGFPLKVSGETDFPCITGSRVGQGRVYVQLGKQDRIDFAAWCKGVADGKSYVSDGYAHPLKFAVNGTAPGFGDVKLDAPGKVTVNATVAFAADPTLGTANGGRLPADRATRRVELIVNGQVAEVKDVPADDKAHDLTFTLPIERSSWVALRHYPQMHTNPVPVLVGGKSIRASRKSAQWCVEVIEQLWRVREKNIAEAERAEADKTFRQAVEVYRKIATEAPEGS